MKRLLLIGLLLFCAIYTLADRAIVTVTITNTTGMLLKGELPDSNFTERVTWESTPPFPLWYSPYQFRTSEVNGFFNGLTQITRTYVLDGPNAFNRPTAVAIQDLSVYLGDNPLHTGCYAHVRDGWKTPTLIGVEEDGTTLWIANFSLGYGWVDLYTQDWYL